MASGNEQHDEHQVPSEAAERVEPLPIPREGFLIRIITAISRACLMTAGKDASYLGLSASQAIVLGELFAHNGCRQDDLRSIVKLDKGNITRAVQYLEKEGLVTRDSDAADRRVTRVHVTGKAISLQAEMYRLAFDWDDELAKGLTPEERATLISLLMRVEENCETMTAPRRKQR